MKDDLPVLDFADAKAFESWLAERHSTADGLWLRMAKAGTGIATVKYPEAVEVALCYGWIDGLARRIDDTYYMQRFTPRRSRSKWSKINRDKVAALIAADRMQPAGLSEVERAKADGRWEAAYDSPRTSTVPDDLQAALDAAPAAAAFFETLNSTNRFAILHRIQDAKRPEARARRISKFVDMLCRGEKLY